MHSPTSNYLAMEDSTLHFLEQTSFSPLSNSTSSSQIELTRGETWIQLIIFYAFLCGFVSLPCSVLIWATIARRKKLHTRFFIIAASLTFCRTLMSAQFLIMAVFRSLRLTGFVDGYQTRIVCHFLHLWVLYGSTVEMVLLCTLVVDRVIAIVAPIYYRSLSNKFALTICVIEYVLVLIIKLAPSYSIDDMLERVMCSNLYSFLNVSFNAFSQTIDFVLAIAILVIYFLLVTYLKWKTKQLRADSAISNVASVKLRRQAKLMPTLRNLVLWHCTIALTAKLLLYLPSYVPRRQSARVIALGGIFTCVDVSTNVLILLFTNRDIRNAALPRRWFRKDGNRVIATSTNA